MQIEFHPEAADEVVAARVWYDERDENIGDDFANAIEAALKQIVEQPEAWSSFLAGTRRYLLRRFPYSVIYRRHLTTIEIVAVAHDHRRPGYWIHRQ